MIQAIEQTLQEGGWVLIALLVSAPVFYVHWRLSQRLEAALE